MQEKKKKVTIKDVTVRADTSIATVSRVLGGSNYPMKEELKMTIINTAEALDYKSNLFSQLLCGGKNHQIGVVIPSVTSPLYGQLIAAVQKECMDNDYISILYSSHSQVQTERSCINMLIQVQVAGVLLSLIYWDEGINSAPDEAGIPYVLFDQPHDDYDGTATGFDFYSFSRLTAEYLIENGHRELVFASSPTDRPSRKELFEGFRDALTDHHIGLRGDNIFVSTASKKSGISTMKDYQHGQGLRSMVLERKRISDALFTVNNMMAIGIMKQLETRQIHIPRDMSILGFDNVKFGEMIMSALITISQSAYRAGKLAVKLLMEYLDGVHTWKERVILEPVLVERESIKKTQ